jgi:hypothetical protein
MNKIWRYFWPPLYGLAVYFTIRLLLDTVTGMRFWERRRWGQTGLEMGYCIIVSYIFAVALRALFRWFDKRWADDMSARRIWREVGYVFVFNLVFQNLFLTTFTALTDDGAQWYDVADINIIPLFYIMSYYGIMRSRTFLKAYIAGKVQLEKITNDQLQTELKFLKAQYHPHFLFNALNAIYFQMDENVAEAKKSVEKFSELLRYQLYDQQQTVPISQEVRYLQTFIDLQALRSSEKVKLTVDIGSGLNGQQVYPLLMLPLVENAFKYVGGEYWIDIKACSDGEEIHFSVRNAIPTEVLHTPRAGGIGLENLRRRLALLYPGTHRFRAEQKDNIYEAELTIKNL